MKILTIINNAGSDFIPQYFGKYEPVKMKYDINNLDGVIELFLNESENKERRNASPPHEEGRLLLEKKRGHKVSSTISWKKNNYADFNYLSFSMGVDWMQDSSNFNRFFELSKQLITTLDLVQGNIQNQSIPYKSDPRDLKLIHPRLHWMNFFGPPYIELFGKEKLLSCPCFKMIEISDQVIALQLTEDLFEPIPEELKTAVKLHLGVDAFLEEGLTLRHYKDKTTLVPDFDFSQVLFDSTKPIENRTM
ncbi:hypothetical protein GC098_23085 [Paenibacillus sp. LMG 31458]|uniref:Uncharacterized protein n=1 Tax=Paenibacillus phytorum TaxID=2654977 RepID=A0ABX1Y051_9BACL|nr:hypothetical protein [Paenibacillus phytorum]NOU74245.1 hypothetical protein [Paenibacillus phytorum]